jgi:hypothetical protein
MIVASDINVDRGGATHTDCGFARPPFRHFCQEKPQITAFTSGRSLEQTTASVMSPRGRLRRLRRKALARGCAALIIALVLCPFTAPFASYDPNASPIGLLAQDGSLLDIACDKAVSVAAAAVTVSAFADVVPLTCIDQTGTTTDLLLLRSMVLRV